MTDIDDIDIAEIEAQRRAAQRIQVAQRRFREESRGVLVAGYMYDTDRESQGRVVGAVLAAQQAKTLGQPFGLTWKARGAQVELDADGVIAMGNAVLSHVQVCFGREKELADEIDAGTYTDDILGTGWPEGSV